MDAFYVEMDTIGSNEPDQAILQVTLPGLPGPPVAKVFRAPSDGSVPMPRSLLCTCDHTRALDLIDDHRVPTEMYSALLLPSCPWQFHESDCAVYLKRMRGWPLGAVAMHKAWQTPTTSFSIKDVVAWANSNCDSDPYGLVHPGEPVLHQFSAYGII